jgi:hypothetical protein
MARGWESKSVEDQIGAREAEAEASHRRQLSPAEAELMERRNGLLLARARTLASLESASDSRYRALLERTLAHLDTQLAALAPVDE